MAESEFRIIDYRDNPEKKIEKIEKLPESFGYNLDTIEKARQWLTNPQNWFKSELFILKWDGLLPRISEKHGRRLIAEPWDDGLPWTVVYEQRQRRSKKDKGEEIEEKEQNVEL